MFGRGWESSLEGGRCSLQRRRIRRQGGGAASQVRAEGVLLVVAGVVVAVVLLLVVVVVGAVVCAWLGGRRHGGSVSLVQRHRGFVGRMGKRDGRSTGRHARSIAAPAEGQPTR